MKNLILPLLALLLVSCSTPELNDVNKEQDNVETIDKIKCADVVRTESTPDGFYYVYVQFEGASKPNKYKVNNPDHAFHKGELICNFAGMTKVNW